MVYWELMGCVRAVELLFVYVHVWIDLHQDPTKSEPSSWGQSDGVTSVSYQLLWHWIHSVVGDSTSGTQSLDFSGEMCKKKHLHFIATDYFALLYTPAGWTRKPCTERADLPLQQHRVLLPSIQSRSLAGKPLTLTRMQTCTHYVKLHLRFLIWFIACHSGLGWLSLRSRLITEGNLRSAHSRLWMWLWVIILMSNVCLQSRLMRLLQRLPASVVRRVHRERHASPCWITLVPEHQQLTDADLQEFTRSLTGASLLAMFRYYTLMAVSPNEGFK